MQKLKGLHPRYVYMAQKRNGESENTLLKFRLIVLLSKFKNRVPKTTLQKKMHERTTKYNDK